jgi:hypothetical protein
MSRPRAGAVVAAAAGLAQLALLFADWFTVAASGPPPASLVRELGGGGILNLLNTYSGGGRASGWDALSAVAITPLLATAALALVLPVSRRVAYAAAALGAVTVVILGLRVAALGDDTPGTRVTVELPAYLCVACAAAIVAGAWAARPGRST